MRIRVVIREIPRLLCLAMIVSCSPRAHEPPAGLAIPDLVFSGRTESSFRFSGVPGDIGESTTFAIDTTMRLQSEPTDNNATRLTIHVEVTNVQLTNDLFTDFESILPEEFAAHSTVLLLDPDGVIVGRELPAIVDDGLPRFDPGLLFPHETIHSFTPPSGRIRAGEIWTDKTAVPFADIVMNVTTQYRIHHVDADQYTVLISGALPSQQFELTGLGNATVQSLSSGEVTVSRADSLPIRMEVEHRTEIATGFGMVMTTMSRSSIQRLDNGDREPH